MTGGVVGGPTMPARTGGGVMSEARLRQALGAQKQKRIQEIVKKLMTMGKPPLSPEMMTPPDLFEPARPMQGQTQPPASPQDMKQTYETHIRNLEERIRNLEARQPNYGVRTLEKQLPEPVTAGSFSNY